LSNFNSIFLGLYSINNRVIIGFYRTKKDLNPGFLGFESMKLKRRDFLLKVSAQGDTQTSLVRSPNPWRFFLQYLMPLLVFIGLIFFVSSQPNLGVLAEGGVDLSVLHVFVYFVLSTLTLRVLLYAKWEYPFTIAILFAILVGLFEELYQANVPGRTPAVIDFLYDASGSLLVLFFKRFPRFIF